MAKHASLRLLAPSTKPLPVRHATGPLPESTLLYRKPIHPGPRLPLAVKRSHDTIQHGQHIYFYNNIQTNQVVYSLTRHLDNADALRQLPFLGKKTQPSHLRKDLWQPYCLASFPSPHAGLSAFRKLREFRRLHETKYPLSQIIDPEKPNSLLPKKKRSRILMNQKANSIADLAAVLLQQEQGVGDDRKARYERVMKRVEQLRRNGKPEKDLRHPVDVSEMEGVGGVTVSWKDVRDAEYAATWPQQVVHEEMRTSRNTAAGPSILGTERVQAVQ